MNLFQEQFKKFVCFSFQSITTYKNEKGEEKKKLNFNGLKWDTITQTTLNNKHFSFAALTGKPSQITVIDIDNLDTYNQLLVKYPLLNDVFKVKTNNGIHLYFNYYEPLKTSSNVMINYTNVDIRYF